MQHTTASFLIELTLTDYSMLQFLPSHMAAAALYTAMELDDKDFHWVVWFTELWIDSNIPHVPSADRYLAVLQWILWGAVGGLFEHTSLAGGEDATCKRASSEGEVFKQQAYGCGKCPSFARQYNQTTGNEAQPQQLLINKHYPRHTWPCFISFSFVNIYEY